MISPMNMYNEIAGKIFEKLPGGDMFYSQLVNGKGRTADAASASVAVTANNSRAVAAKDGNTATVSSAVNTGDVTFDNIMEYFSKGGEVEDSVRELIETEIELAAARHNIDPNLVRAVIRVESNYRPDAVSGAGAMGLMQLMPGTAAAMGVTNPFDISQNIEGGTAYLRRQLDAFDGDIDLAVAAYNAGSPAVRRHGGIPPFPETQKHVPRVRQFFEEYTLQQYQRAAEDSRFTQI